MSVGASACAELPKAPHFGTHNRTMLVGPTSNLYDAELRAGSDTFVPDGPALGVVEIEKVLPPETLKVSTAAAQIAWTFQPPCGGTAALRGRVHGCENDGACAAVLVTNDPTTMHRAEWCRHPGRTGGMADGALVALSLKVS